MPNRKRGGQPGNGNAIKHGRFSALVRAARVAVTEERAQQNRAWLMAMPKTDYGAICDAIKAHGRNKPRADQVRVL